MDDALKDFDRRANAVRKNHARLARGYVTKINKNGLIEHQPVRIRAAGKSLRWAVCLVIGLLAFKGVVLSDLGAEIYAGHLNDLSQGTAVERIGSVLMSVDPVTQLISDTITRVRA